MAAIGAYKMEKRKPLSLVLIFFVVISAAHAFVINAEIDLFEGESSMPPGYWLKPADFVIDATTLERKYRWHGVYHVVPSSYNVEKNTIVLVWFMEPKKPMEKKATIDLEKKMSDPSWLKFDCVHGPIRGWSVAPGEERRCDASGRKDGINKDGIIIFRVDSIESDGVDVTIKFSVKFRLDGDYSDWISEAGEITINGENFTIKASQKSLESGEKVVVAGEGLEEKTEEAKKASEEERPTGPAEGPGCELHIVKIGTAENMQRFNDLEQSDELGVRKFICEKGQKIVVELSGSPECNYLSLSAILASSAGYAGKSIKEESVLSLENVDEALSALSEGKTGSVSFQCGDEFSTYPFMRFVAQASKAGGETSIVESEVIKIIKKLERPEEGRPSEGPSPTFEKLEPYIAGVDNCSPKITKVEISNALGGDSIYICDSEGNAVENTITTEITYSTASECQIQQICLTLWRYPMEKIPAADIEGNGISMSERYYFALLWWLYVAGKHYNLPPYGTSSQEEFENAAKDILAGLFQMEIGMYTWENYFYSYTYTKCFDSQQTSFTFNISKETEGTEFLDLVGAFSPEGRVYLTAQILTQEGRWFIAENQWEIPLEIGNCEAAKEPSEEEKPEEAPPEEKPEEKPEEGEVTVVEGPRPPEEAPPEEKPEEELPPVEIAGCEPCLSVVGCLGCIDLLTLRAIPS